MSGPARWIWLSVTVVGICVLLLWPPSTSDAIPDARPADSGSGQEAALDSGQFLAGAPPVTRGPDEAGSPSVLRVRVEDQEQQPVAETRVSALQVDGGPVAQLSVELSWGSPTTVHYRELASELTSNRGRAEFRPRVEDYPLLLYVEQGDAVATLLVGTPPEESVLLRLNPRGEQRVRVLSADGRPLAGVAVEIDDREHGRRSMRQGGVRTNSAGEARLPFFSDRTIMAWTRGEAIHVQAEYLGVVQVRSFSEVDSIPDVIELQFPEHGAVHVVGLPWDSRGSVVLTHTLSTEVESLRQLQSRILHDEVKFPAVTPGDHQVIARVYLDGTDGSLSMRGPAPASFGDLTVLDFSTLQSVALTGRIVDQDGAPVHIRPGPGRAKAAMFLSLSDGTTRDHFVHTQQDGRFRWLLDDVSEGLDVTGVFLRWGTQVAGSELQLALGGGESDVGNLQLKPADVLVSGIAQLPDGTPVTDFQVAAYSVDAPEALVPLPEADVFTAQDGSFQILQLSPNPPLRCELHVGEFDEYYAEPIEFLAGTEGLKVEVRQAGSVDAWWSLGNSPLVRQVWADLEVSGMPGVSPGGWSETEEDGSDVRSAVWNGLPAGEYDLIFRILGVPGEFHRVSGLEVVDGGDCDDRRIQGMRIDDYLRHPTLTLLRTDGTAVLNPKFCVETAEGTGQLPVHDAGEGRWQFLFGHRHSIDVLVDAPGFLPLRVRDLRGHRQLTLEPALPLELNVSKQLLSSSAAAEIELTLMGAESVDELYCRVPWERRHRDSAHSVFTVRLASAGDYRLRWTVRDDGQATEYWSTIHVAESKLGGKLEIQPPAEFLAHLRRGT